MSENIILGQRVTGEAYRDAIHIALVPVFAGRKLLPAQRVAVQKDAEIGVYFAIPEVNGNAVGIVDPYLRTPIMRDEKFWLFLFQNTVTSLRHEWTHPAFEAERSSAASASERWLREYAEGLRVAYDDLIKSAAAYQDNGDYMVRGGLLEGCYTSDEFWTHWERVTGRLARDRSNFFSCSC